MGCFSWVRADSSQYWDGTGAGATGAVRVGNAQYWTARALGRRGRCALATRNTGRGWWSVFWMLFMVLYFKDVDYLLAKIMCRVAFVKGKRFYATAGTVRRVMFN